MIHHYTAENRSESYFLWRHEFSRSNDEKVLNREETIVRYAIVLRS